jgi:hypothetical protein
MMEVIPMLILLVVMLVREWTFHAEREEERNRHEKETQVLLQRIQDPIAAVVEHAIEKLPEDREPIGMPMMTDEDYTQLLA